MDRTPPKDIDAEKTLLSALIIDPSMYYIVSGIVTDQSFYATKHQKVFNAITSLVRDDIPIDLVSLSNKLDGQVSRSDIVEIANSSPTGANAEYHAKVVAEKCARRKAIYTLHEAFNKAYTAEDITSIVATVQRELDRALPQKRSSSDIFPAVVDTVERLIDLPRGGVKNYLPTGFSRLDSHVKLTPGTLTLVAADPGVGKTSYLLCVARHMARHGRRPLLFTLEMGREQILENLVAQELGLCHKDMINGELSDQDNGRLAAGVNRFKDLNIGVLDGRWTTGEIRHQVITEIRTKGADCFMVDALGDIDHEKGTADKQTHEIYNADIREFVRLAVEVKIPSLVTHHLNKSEGKRGKNNKPTRQSLMQAGDKLSHNVILLYREYLETGDTKLKEQAEAIIVKARDGETGMVPLGFNGPTKSFYNLAYQHEERQTPAVMGGAEQWGN